QDDLHIEKGDPGAVPGVVRWQLVTSSHRLHHVSSRSGDDPQDVLVRTAHDLRRTVAGQSRFPVRNVDEEPDAVPRDVAYDLALEPVVPEPCSRSNSLTIVRHGRTAEASLRGTNRRLRAVTCAGVPGVARLR